MNKTGVAYIILCNFWNYPGILVLQSKCPLSQMLGISQVSWSLKSLHISNEVHWAMRPESKQNNSCSLRVILYNILNNFVHKTKFFSVEFSCQCSKGFGFWSIWILDFGVEILILQRKNWGLKRLIIGQVSRWQSWDCNTRLSSFLVPCCDMQPPPMALEPGTGTALSVVLGF